VKTLEQSSVTAAYPTISANATHATIAATATALPENTMTRADMRYYFGRVFDIPERRIEAMMAIVDNAQVDQRHSIFPIDYTIEPRPLSKTNDEYIQHSIRLGRQAAEEALRRAKLTPQDIDLIIAVSCTGLS
jgi:predicted naringenin-chalcone synthase